MATDQDSELPLDASSPYYSLPVVLEGIVYTFVVRWNDRGLVTRGCWLFDLLDENGDEENPIATGVPIVLGALLGRHRAIDPRFPNGGFFASDLSGSDQEATINDLGTRVKVYFRPASAF